MAASTQAVRPWKAVLVHGVEIQNVDTSDLKAAIRHLIEQNKALHPGLEILKVNWPRKVYKSGKKFLSVIVGVATKEQANRLIREGFIEGQELKTRELF